MRPHALARARPPRRCSPGHFPSRACPIHDSGFGLSRRQTPSGFVPRRACLREPSHLASIARPELRRLGSRTQDLPARCGRSNPRATVRRRPSLENRSRRFPTPIASLTPLSRSEASCLRPLSAAPRASRVLHDRNPGGVPTAGPRRRSVKPCWWASLLRGQPALGVSFLFESARESELAAVLAYPTFEP